MPFEQQDFHDLDWREELRTLLLTQELLTLPALVQGLSETVAHLSDRMDQLTLTVTNLTEGQQRLTDRMDQLTLTVTNLAEGQQRLAEGQQRLTEEQRRLDVQMGEVRGWTLEQRYRTYAVAYFGRFLRQVRPIDIGRLADALRERVGEQALAEILLADLILTGRPSMPTGPSEIWIVVEVSATVDRSDVERAQRRAALLRQAHYPAVAVAGGWEVTAGARQVASEIGVALLLNGRVDGWQAAFDYMIAEGTAGPL